MRSACRGYRARMPPRALAGLERAGWAALGTPSLRGLYHLKYDKIPVQRAVCNFLKMRNHYLLELVILHKVSHY